jgi:hypothetical protein
MHDTTDYPVYEFDANGLCSQGVKFEKGVGNWVCAHKPCWLNKREGPWRWVLPERGLLNGYGKCGICGGGFETPK